MKTLAIVGGGAAGLTAAIAAGERARELGVPLRVDVYERDDRVGRSILATGNGRCNFSNAHLDVACYRNAPFVQQAFDAFESSGASVLGFFESCGLAWREETDGRMYPQANKASAVLDVLRAAAAGLGVLERCGRGVKAVEMPRQAGKLFTLRMDDGVFQRADAVVVACGGRALERLSIEGFDRVKLQPVLGPLRVVDAEIPLVRELDNIRVRGSVALLRPHGGRDELLAAETGEVMFRKYGVSGICVFNVSRLAQPGDFLRIALVPCQSVREARALLQRRRALLEGRFGATLTCDDLLRGLVLPRVADVLFKRIGARGEDACDDAAVADLAHVLAEFPLTVAGIGDADVCQVRRGGLPVGRFDCRTMQVTGVQGLFAAGEALDVDGPCGGYNLHWAWTSGLAAGRAAADLACAATPW